MARRPSAGNISAPYGWRTHPITGARQLHTGEDIGWVAGTNLVAPIDCVVDRYYWAGGYGNMMVLKSGDTEIWLAHTDHLKAAVGTHVHEGDLVAIMGTTGNSTGVHVHWEIRVNGVRLDPAAWLASKTTPAGGTGTQIEENDMADITETQMQRIAVILLDTTIQTAVGDRTVKQALSDALLLGRAAADGIKLVPGAVWAAPLEHTLAKDADGVPVQVPAGDLLRYEPAEHENTRVKLAQLSDADIERLSVAVADKLYKRLAE